MAGKPPEGERCMHGPHHLIDSMGCFVAVALIIAIVLILTAFFGPSLMLMR